MKLIEFAGVRAVGKSTMMRHLIDQHPERFIWAAVNGYQKEWDDRMRFPHHAEFEKLVRTICLDYKPNPMKLPRSWFIALRDYDARKLQKDDRAAIFDQGLVQYARGVTLLTRSKALVRDYLELVPVPDVVVLFDVSEATCIARNEVRDTKIKKGHLPWMFVAMDLIKETISKRTRLVVIDGEPSIDIKAKQIITLLV